MKIDAGLPGGLEGVKDAVARLEELGYDGVITAETAHDPFFPLLLAAEHSSRIELMTSIAVAFARNPMLLANIGHDLNAYSKGRFILGLGSQIKPHISKRFSMPWSSPAARMREFILAMRAIWDNWHNQEPLAFTGKFYTHTLMTPMFTPTDTEYGPPRVFLAAVGPKMTEVAGEVADGILIHAFTTKRYLEETTLPALERGMAAAGRSREDVAVTYPGFIVTGATEEDMAASRVATTRQIAFYGSTPAYRPVLEAHGWGEMQDELNTMSKQGRWAEMGELIDDSILGEFAIVGEPADIVAKFRERWGGLVDRATFSLPVADDAALAAAIRELAA